MRENVAEKLTKKSMPLQSVRANSPLFPRALFREHPEGRRQRGGAGATSAALDRSHAARSQEFAHEKLRLQGG